LSEVFENGRNHFCKCVSGPFKQARVCQQTRMAMQKDTILNVDPAEVTEYLCSKTRMVKAFMLVLLDLVLHAADFRFYKVFVFLDTDVKQT
jgi:hypothetical protein